MRTGLLAALLALSACQPVKSEPEATAAEFTETRVLVRVREDLSNEPLQGRLLVLLTPVDEPAEPRFAVRGDDSTAQVFGVDVDEWTAGQTRSLTGDVVGAPLATLAAVPPGDYKVQALLHRYETFNRADGHVVKLPPDRGEGQQWSLAPGNLYSTPRTLRISAGSSLELELDQVIAPLAPVSDTRLLRHVELESPRLTKFWGRSVKLGARVLLPEGWDTHPQAHYPLMIVHSHFARDMFGYRDSPADPTLPPVDLAGLRRDCPNGHGEKCAQHGYTRMVQEMGYAFHQLWTGPAFPRVLLVQIEHANPYYDDSYAVNSENLGPYGDAITYELVPHLEREFRGLGAWARGMYGGSTGGWEAIAAQVLYPTEYNGAVGNCPDPLDFRAYTTIDIYGDANAYRSEGPFRSSPRIASRRPDGTLLTTVEDDNRMELALGGRSRSGQQFDIWEAVYSPVGADGYPRRIFDKRTGVIDREVAEHWRRNYDIGHKLTSEWPRLAADLRGKLWIFTGDMDTYFLERSVRHIEARLAALDPPADATVVYGHGHGHCWSGDTEHMNFESRLTYHARFIPLLVDRFLRTAPPGADTTSWRY